MAYHLSCKLVDESDVKRNLMSELKEGIDALEARRNMTNEEIIAETLALLPVGYLPNHTPESIPWRVQEWVERAVKAEEELERYKDLADYMFMLSQQMRKEYEQVKK